MSYVKTCISFLIAAQVVAVWSAASAEPTQDLQEHLSIPIRWCAMQGSPAVENSSAVDGISIDDVLRNRHTRATVFVWMPQSGVSFRSALTNEMRHRSGFPVIKDPHPPSRDGLAAPEERGIFLPLPSIKNTSANSRRPLEAARKPGRH